MPRLKKRADGRYQKKVTLPDGTQKFVYATSEKELNKRAEEIRKSFVSGVDLTDDTRVEQWAVEWMKVYKSALRYKTLEAYLNALNNHINPQIGKLRLQSVKAVHVQAILTSVADKSESLQRKVLNTLKQLFRDARINHLIIFDPTEGAKITANTKDTRIKFLSEEQQNQLVEATVEPRAKAFVALCLYAGLRREEALGLQWSDIDMTEDNINITRAVGFIGNQADPDTSLKTKAANRTIPLLTPLKNILLDTPKKGLFIITPISGRMISLTAFRRMWYYAKSKVKFEVHPHMLRHTYATILHKAGIDLKTAQYLLGHSDIKMTANIYMHIEQGQTKKAAAKIEHFLSGSHTGSQITEKALNS